MALGTVDAPYIHSKVYNLHRYLDSVRFDSKNNPNNFAFIKTLETQRDTLKSYTESIYKALGASDINDFNKKIFGYGDVNQNFKQVAILAGQDSTFIKEVSDWRGYTVQEILNNVESPALREELLEYFSTIGSEISSSELLRIIREIFKKNIDITATGKQQVEKFTSLFGKDLTDVKLWDHKIRSDKSRIITTVANRYKQALDKRVNKSIIKRTVTEIRESYIKAFYRTAERLNIVFATDTNENFNDKLREYAQGYAEEIMNGILATTSNTLGTVGEWGISYNIIQSGIEINISNTGALSEEKMSEQFNLPKLVTFHDVTKQSQTDLLMVVNTPKGEVRFRVQSKNSYLKDIQNQLLKESDVLGHSIRLQEKIKLTDLLFKLLNDNAANRSIIMTEEDATNLAYILANAAWFRKSEGRAKTLYEGGLSGPLNEANKLINLQVQDFIGMTLADIAGDASKRITEGSNIFYLVGNKAFYPTYLILDHLITQLQDNENKAMKQMTITFYDGTNFAYDDALDFYEAKQKSVGRLIPGGSYTDSRLLDVGRKQGRSIMETLKVSVNLNLNMLDVLEKSALVF